MLDKESSNIFLLLALFPITGILGLHTLFLNNIGPKIFHITSGIILIALSLVTFLTNSSQNDAYRGIAIATVLLPVIICAIGLYIYTVIEAIYLYIKARKK